MFHHQFPSTSKNFQGNRYPDEFIQAFCSLSYPNQMEWVSAKFSPHTGQEHKFVLGSEEGIIALCNAKNALDDGNLIEKFLKDTSNNVIFDFCFIPHVPNWLVSLSGDSQIRIWDIETQSYWLLFGHTKSVRSASVWPDNPYLLVTGSRNGSILCWDLRSQKQSLTIASNIPKLYMNPIRTYRDAHTDPMTNSLSITGLLHIGNESIISASSSSSSGIHVWDLRYVVSGGPARTFEVPSNRESSGITSLCWDRFQSSFFASCTDNAIHEYMPSVQSEKPIRTLNGKDINSFFVQCNASPVSDHLICGSSSKKTYIWDLQEARNYRQDYLLNKKTTTHNYLPEPKFSMEGHDSEAETVQWSSYANYILTLGSDCIRIWSKWVQKNENGYPNKILINDQPINFLYPTLLKNKPVSEEFQNKSGIRFKKKSNERNSPLPYQRLGNFPAISLERSFAGCAIRKTPKKITIKANTFLTPASKIPSTEGHENLSTKKTPRRNLTAELQRQKNTPGSSGKRGNKRPGGPSPSPIVAGKHRRVNIKKSRRSLQQQKSPTGAAVKSSSETTPTILRYFSPVPSDRIIGADNSNTSTSSSISNL